MLEFRECDAEIDSEWSLQWNKTKPKNDVVQECPGEFPIGQWLLQKITYGVLYISLQECLPGCVIMEASGSNQMLAHVLPKSL